MLGTVRSESDDRYATNVARADTNPDRSALTHRKSKDSGDSGPLRVQSFGRTHRGLVRPSNEDQFLIGLLTKAMRVQQSSLSQPRTWCAESPGRIFLVADGIGGARGGDRASALAVWTIEDFLVNTLKWFCKLEALEQESVVAELQGALRQADERVSMESAGHPELDGMGTTLTLAYSQNTELFVVHAGDSRCYLYRDGTLGQLTRDHTVAAELAERGVIPRDEVRCHPMRHVVTNVVGGHKPGVQAEVHKIHLEARDVLLLATDGLTRMVPDDQIARTLATELTPRTACDRLMNQAITAGGRDNVTIIVVRYDRAA